MSSGDCGCIFDACDCDNLGTGQECEPGQCPESWHYLRTCRGCGRVIGALHCPHDGAQNRCTQCGWVDPGARTPMQILGMEPEPVPVDSEEKETPK